MALNGVEVVIDGVKHFGAKGYTVTEDSTPVDPSDMTGGSGQFSVEIDQEDIEESERLSHFDALRLHDLELSLTDGSQGVTRGLIRGESSADGDMTITVDSALALLNVERQAEPFTGTLEDAFTYYLTLAGYTGGIVVDDSIASRPVVFPGWSGIVSDFVKKMCISQKVEYTLASSNAVLRPLRQRIAEDYRDASRTWNLDTSQLARSIEIYYYQNEYNADRLAYPVGGWNEDVEVIVVNANETVVHEYPISASLTSVEQPVCVDFVDQYEASTSVYAVTGTGANSDLPIPPAQWADEGGSLTVEIMEDTKTLRVTVVGPNNTQYSPYRIAMPSGDSNYYSSLRIMGAGVFFDKKLLTLNTSVDHDRVTEEVGVTIDNEFISTIDQAHELGRWALKRYGAPRYTISVTTSGINWIGDTGSYHYPTVGDFNALYAGMTVGDFNTVWAGMTIQDFNEFMASLVADDFENQAFGNVAGARVRFGDAMFRIRSADIGPNTVSYTAEEDTTIEDFNAVWAGATIADFNAEWAGYTFKDFAIAPLRRTT